MDRAEKRIHWLKEGWTKLEGMLLVLQWLPLRLWKPLEAIVCILPSLFGCPCFLNKSNVVSDSTLLSPSLKGINLEGTHFGHCEGRVGSGQARPVLIYVSVTSLTQIRASLCRTQPSFPETFLPTIILQDLNQAE